MKFRTIFAALIVATLYVLGAASSHGQFVAECRYGFCSSGDAVSSTPISTACSTASTTTTTFTAQGIGTANPNRISVVSINWSDSTLAGTAELSGVTLGGVAMTRAVRSVGDNQNSNSEIWYLANPTGTSANIVVTSSTAINGITIGVYSLVGYRTVSTSAIGTTTITTSYSNKQVALAAASRRVNVSTSLSNMTNDFSSACGANLWGVHASQRLSGNSSLTTTISPTSNTPLIAMAIWSTDTPFVCTGSLAPNAVPGTTAIGWWDASVTASLNLTAAVVNSWTDQTTGKVLVQGTAFAKPTYSATAFNTSFPGVIMTTATGSALEVGSFPMGTGNTLTWFIVTQTAQASSNSSPRYLSYAKPASNDFDNVGSWTWAGGNSPQVEAAFSRDTTNFPATVLTFSAGYHVFAGTVDSNGQVTLYMDCGAPTIAQIAPGNWVSAGTFAIGHQATVGGGGHFITAVIAEAVILIGVPTPANIGQVINGLKSKWGTP